MPTQREVLDELNADNSVVIVGSKVRVMRWQEVHHEASGERYVYRVPVYMTFEDIRNFYSNRFTVNADDDAVSIGGWWLKQPSRPTYKGVVFAPGGAPVINDRINLWRGFGVEPERGDWGRMQDHMFNVLADKNNEVFEYMLNWCAFAIQFPGEQAEVMLAFQGGFGTGKGLLGRAMCRIFGPHGKHISEASHLTGKFNSHFQMCCFLFADEAFAPQDKRAEGVIKRLLTEPTLMIEPKGIDPFQIDNHLHVLSASNHEWMVMAGEKERRAVVSKVAEDKQQNDEHFKPLYHELANGGLKAMMAALLDRPLAGWHPRRIVRTAALAEQQMESLGPFDQWLLELLTSGVLPGAILADASIARSNEYEEPETKIVNAFNQSSQTRYVKKPGLYDHARRCSPRLKGVSDTALGRFLRDKVGCFNWRSEDARGWKFKPLEELRADWRRRFPATVWPPHADGWGHTRHEGVSGQILDFPE
jgi:hypothetical protein